MHAHRQQGKKGKDGQDLANESHEEISLERFWPDFAGTPPERVPQERWTTGEAAQFFSVKLFPQILPSGLWRVGVIPVEVDFGRGSLVGDLAEHG
jgi:hypothetical protein